MGRKKKNLKQSFKNSTYNKTPSGGSKYAQKRAAQERGNYSENSPFRSIDDQSGPSNE